jgi:nicotinamide mononucleotide transporter
MEASLQIFYIFMGVYGWSQWKSKQPEFVVNNWSSLSHFKAISLILLLTLSSGYLLDKHTEAALPFLDALTTWGAIIATYMVAKKLIENWIYWFVIDSISIFLFISRDLHLTALLFAGYLVIIFFGYRSWSKARK